MGQLLYPIIISLFIAGCTTLPKEPNAYAWDAWNGGYIYKNYEVEIITDPPGAKIEFNEEYLGDTPRIIKLDGEYGPITIRVLPIYQGHFVQTKHFSYKDVVPHKIYFNMTLGYDQDININIK